MNSMIRTENLTRAYGGVTVVDSMNIEVGKGEVCGFIGPNGSGKTTTICMMVGLVEPTGGRCFINDIEVAKNPIKIKRMVGYLPDGFGFYGHMSAAQNLKFFSKLYNITDADAKIKSLLDYVGLSDVKKPVEAYSKGMAQRLGLARARKRPAGHFHGRADQWALPRGGRPIQESRQGSGFHG